MIDTSSISRGESTQTKDTTLGSLIDLDLKIE